MGKLTTHVLDTSAGIPAAGVRIEIYDATGPAPALVGQQTTGVDGRCAAPLLEGDGLRRGRYQLTFKLADYFRTRGVTLSDPAFLEEATVRVGIAWPEQHYHVPLLITPWSYSVYRGG
jgi:5-hydroxyisourate hydrolase